ncbi:MAG: hypothetical protein ABS95_02345 [Verrucomicrobia bacterium SCN 57-15]|nr:MAG: hypothetical protein ABS95_02345 [Verrucomicrobia bacterium SCN 57-15]
MKFDAAPPTRNRALEAAQRYRGITFTDRGEILLDVGNVKDGRVRLSQSGQRLSLLPETIFSIHQAWKDGDIPVNGTVPWECSTFSPQSSEVDEIRCSPLDEEHLRVSDKCSNAAVSISRDQLKSVVECIVEPWLANFPSGLAKGAGHEIASPPQQANKSQPVPLADLS